MSSNKKLFTLIIKSEGNITSAKSFIVDDMTKLKRNPIENDEVDKASKDRLRKKWLRVFQSKNRCPTDILSTH
jgi:hypothetical protein